MALDRRLLCYVRAVVSIFLCLSHSRSFVHDPPAIETAALVDCWLHAELLLTQLVPTGRPKCHWQPRPNYCFAS